MKLDWDKMDGLIPAVVQDADTAELLMVGYMNAEALEQTRASGQVTFFSRSRRSLWTKGETSGNTLELVGVDADCDGDALRVRARPTGPVCHRGTRTCFGEQAEPELAFLGRLQRLVEERYEDRPAASYTTTLFDGGLKRIAQKVGEEGTEAAIAGATGDRDGLVDEAADLLYHLLVLLTASNSSLSEVADRLRRRHAGTSANPP